MLRNTIDRAKTIKEELIRFIGVDNFSGLTPYYRPDAFHNPVALASRFMSSRLFYSNNSRAFLHECYASSKLVIQEDHLSILRDFYESRRTDQDALGLLYHSMTFENFLLRLFHKRYREVYLDGRAVVAREGVHDFAIHNMVAGRKFLYGIGTRKDKKELYKEYLTLEETMISVLILPQVMSVVIGTGNRSRNWDVVNEFVCSIDVAVYSYPAAAEFRNGDTTHYDLLFMAIPAHGYTMNQLRQIQHIQRHPALVEAAKKIYGDQFAFAETDLNAHINDYMALYGPEDEIYYLHKQAYLNRTKHVLKQVLLSADHELEKYKLGKTFQLKGLGLGAFSFSSEQATAILEDLYIVALKQVLNENSLHYINRINLINLPTTFGLLKDQVFDEFNINGIQVMSSDMDPTIRRNTSSIGLVGGTVFCGDSGSQVGNEGNMGLFRNSSDDPATQYSLLDPKILDPAHNENLKDASCLYVMSNDRKLATLAEFESRSMLTMGR